MSLRESLLIRADADYSIGTGHVMRCLALAQAWCEQGGKAFVLSAELPHGLVTRLESEGFSLSRLTCESGSPEDAKCTVGLANKVGARWIVVDGYQFDAEYQRIIKAAGLPLMVFDDYGHADHYSADIVLNQNSYARESLYLNRESQTKLLLGTNYVVLRREFWSRRNWKRSIIRQGAKILITLGGSDQLNVSTQVVQALMDVMIDDLEILVVTGAAFRHWDSLATLRGSIHSKLQILQNVTNMSELMAWADMAIATAGSTVWEMAYMGLPGMLLIAANNQRDAASDLTRRNVFWSLGDLKDFDHNLIVTKTIQLSADHTIRNDMSVRGRKLVDGLGVERLLALLG